MIKINIARDFTTTPGARYKKDGAFSGEEFREKFLEKYFIDSNNEEIIEVTLDGVQGYSTSFLEEAFGGLARNSGVQRCLNKFVFISNEDPLLIEEILGYIKEMKNDK